MPKDWSSGTDSKATKAQDEAFLEELKEMRRQQESEDKASMIEAEEAWEEKHGARRELHRLSDNGMQAMRGSDTFRCSNSDLGGEVRTSTAQEGELHSIAKAEVHRRNGTSDEVGRARFSVTDDEATLAHDDFSITPAYDTDPALLSEARKQSCAYAIEDALLSEVSEQSRAQGAQSLRVWVRDGESHAEERWRHHGFLPGERDPGAAGVHWRKPLGSEESQAKPAA
jgi:hypothetical protein